MGEVFVSHLDWSGAAKGPTRHPGTFSRELDVTIGGRLLPMSSAPAFRGDASRLNPEQLLVASLSSCQALTYLYVAARNQITVVAYADDAEGRLGMVDGGMRMELVTLRPRITLEAGADIDKARELVREAHRGCFIGNSVQTRVEIEPTFVLLEAHVGSSASSSSPV